MSYFTLVSELCSVQVEQDYSLITVSVDYWALPLSDPNRSETFTLFATHYKKLIGYKSQGALLNYVKKNSLPF